MRCGGTLEQRRSYWSYLNSRLLVKRRRFNGEKKGAVTLKRPCSKLTLKNKGALKSIENVIKNRHPR